MILCKNNDDKSPNVPATIAGYYYQILLACREITKLYNDNDCVGVEANADVRIEENREQKDNSTIIIEKYKTSLEAKFHKDNFSPFDEDIVKTIYNFYRYTSEDEKFIFSTNVSINSKSKEKELLEVNWEKEGYEDEKIKFIKRCILRHSVKHDTEELYKEYIKLKKNSGINANINTLEEDIFEKNSEKYEKFAFVKKDFDYLEFAKKIVFHFEDRDKQETIKELRKEILINIKSNYTKYTKLVDNGGEDIINALIYEYFEIVTRNSMITDKNPGYDKIEKLSVKNMKLCIEQYKDRVKKFNELSDVKVLLESIELAENEFIEGINNPQIYCGSHKDKILDKFKFLINRFQTSIRNEENYKEIIKKFSIGSSSSWIAVLEAIKQAAIISALENCDEKEVAIGLDEKQYDSINENVDNVFIADTIKYSYKKYDTSTTKSLEEFIIRFANGLDYSKINENQIVVTSGLLSDERPCEMKDELKSEDFLSGVLFDVCETNIDTLQKNIIYLKKIDYKCDECIALRKDDKKMEKKAQH